MLDKLTPQQERQLIEFRAQCLEIGLRTGPVNMDVVSPIIAKWYRYIGKAVPYVWHCESPMMAQLVINVLIANLSDNLIDNLRANLSANLSDNLSANLSANLRANLSDNLRANLRDNLRANLRDNLRANLSANRLKYFSSWFWGNLDIYWLSFYEYPKKYLGIKYNEQDVTRLNEWLELADNCGFFFPFDGICFVCDRPTVIRKDAETRLHCDFAPSVEFSDGWKLYYWHGISVPERAVLDINSYQAKEILAERNGEVRRALMSLYGWERILPEVNAKLIDKHPDPTIGELYEFFIDGQKYHVAMVQDGTPIFQKKGKPTYRKYAIGTRTSLNKIVASIRDTYPLFRNLSDQEFLSIPRT
jgi:uncharacterized protein DUF6745